MENLLIKTIKHFRKGTLLNAIRHRLEVGKWNKFTQGKKYIDYQFDNDIKLKLYTDSKLSRILYQKKFEEEELAFYKVFLKPNYVVLDIGANIGLHVLYAAKLVAENGKVYAFEPVKKTCQRLLENISLNRFENIQAFNLAISNTSGVTDITISLEGYDAWNSLAGKSSETGEKFGKEKIETITLDEFATKNLQNLKVDFIKVDTEGWESNVILGGTEYLTKNNPVLMVEYAEDICKNFGISTTEIYDRLTDLGYYLYKFNHNNMSLRKIKREERFGVANLIASKDPHFKI